MWALARLLSRLAGGPSRRVRPVPTESDGWSTLSDFERSSLRWAYEVLLAEYAALREEIQTVRQEIDRSYAYMFGVVGALAASQLISNPAVASLNRHPTMYLIGAILSLWFPLNYLNLSVDLTSLGSYLREVTAPKLNDIVEAAVKETAAAYSIPADRMVGWSGKVARLLPISMRHTFAPPMSWDGLGSSMRLSS